MRKSIIPKNKILESIILAGIIFAVNLIIYSNPGFIQWAGLPYLIAPVIFAGFYGLAWGLLEAGITLVAGFVLFPLVQGKFNIEWLTALASALQYSGPIAGLGLLAASFIYNRQQHFRREFLARLRIAIHTQTATKRKATSLERVNRVLEYRVVNQKDSITLLRSQVHKLASLNLEQALCTLLETIHLFTETSSASIWIPSTETGGLKTTAIYGWPDPPLRQTQINLDNSMEGYVYRNGKPFSVRMSLGTQEFARLNIEYNILTLPIRVRNRVWGVLNIEDLPFERYSLYTESVLEILLSLIEPYLADILDHEALFDLREVDQDTGLPQVTQLYRTLARELEHRGQSGSEIALVVLEISNFTDLVETWVRGELKRLFPRIKDSFDTAHKMKSRAFHFKSDNQMAFLFNGLDQDGISFLCLDLLSTILELGLQIDGKPVPLEMIVGFSTSHESETGENMIAIAENLLEMQRL